MTYESPSPPQPMRISAVGGLETFIVVGTEPAATISTDHTRVDSSTVLTGALTDYLCALYAAIFVPPSDTLTTEDVTCLSRPYIERRLRDSLAVLRGSPSGDVFVDEFVAAQPFNIPDPEWRLNTDSLMAVINRRARKVDPALLALILLIYGTDTPEKIKHVWNGTFFLPVSDGTLVVSPFEYRPTIAVSRNIVGMPAYWRWMDSIFPVDQGGYSQAIVATIAARTALPLSPASLVRTATLHAAAPRPFANVMANLVTTRWLTTQRSGTTPPTNCGAVAQWAQMHFFGGGAAVLSDKSWFLGFCAERESEFNNTDSLTRESDDTLLLGALTQLGGGRLSKNHYDLSDIGSGESLVVGKGSIPKSPFAMLALEAAQENTEETQLDGGSVDVESDEGEDPTSFDPDTDVPTDPEDDDPTYSEEDDTIAPPDQDTGRVGDDSIEPFALSPNENTLSAYLYRRAVHQLCTQLNPTSIPHKSVAVLQWWCSLWLYIAPTAVTKSLIEKLGLAESLRPFMNGA